MQARYLGRVFNEDSKLEPAIRLQWSDGYGVDGSIDWRKEEVLKHILFSSIWMMMNGCKYSI